MIQVVIYIYTFDHGYIHTHTYLRLRYRDVTSSSSLWDVRASIASPLRARMGKGGRREYEVQFSSPPEASWKHKQRLHQFYPTYDTL